MKRLNIFNPIEKVVSLVTQKLDALVAKKIIDEKNRKYLLGNKHKLGRFYLLPKIHKRLSNVPGRPVISNCGTATERISEFVDFNIQLLVKNITSIILATNHFLQRLENIGMIPEDATIYVR